MTTTALFYITAHGFGHASRSLEVIAALNQQRPDLDIVVRSAVPKWFLESSSRSRFRLEPVATDTGMVQIDSLTFDEAETIRRAASFYQDFDRRVQEEAAAIRRLGATLVVGDIPPLAFAAAKAAGVTSVAIGNFTWDWIYEFYPQFERDAPGVLNTVRSAYRSATRALRLPFHGGFEPMRAVVHDISLIARRSNRSRADVRDLLSFDSSRPIVLGSFGGHTLRLPYGRIAANGGFTLVVTDYEAGRADADELRASPFVKLLTPAELSEKGLRYVDLVSAADVVVSKPGYGIVAECVANGAALLYTSRGRFAENAVFDAELPRVLRSRPIAHDDVVEGRWADAVHAVLAQPPAPDSLSVDGAERAAGEIAGMLERASV